MTRLRNCRHFMLLLSIFYFSGKLCSAQDTKMVRYFDSSWGRVSAEEAFYYTEIVKEDTFYRYTSYWMRSKKINCRSTFADTGFSKPLGTLIRYYETGQTEDSTLYTNGGSMQNQYHFYPGGKLWVHYTYNAKTKREVTEAFDINGTRIDDFIFLREASFQEDAGEWQNFLAENIKGQVPVKKGAPLGKYQVVVKFIIEKDGKVTIIGVETNHGYGMEEEAIRVIKKSPRWNPAIYLGKSVRAYRRQPVTFLVEKG